jgi:hypothetical protein
VKKIFLLLTVFALAGCSGGGGDTEYSPEELFDGYTPKPEVDWGEYPSSLKQTIDSAEAESDCSGLQSIFDTYINAGAVDVADYVDSSLSSAGCYN